MEGAAFITPMMPWNSIGIQEDVRQTAVVNAEASLFKDVFKNTISGFFFLHALFVFSISFPVSGG